MGRPPVGKVAMTSTERSQRRRHRLRATKRNETAGNETATKLDGATKSGATKLNATGATKLDREATAARMRADFEAHARECAQWGGRPKRVVIDDIKRLLSRHALHCSDAVRQIIIDTLAPHVRDQAKIERGISRRTFRKVLADLHTDRNPANAEAFIAFKKLDERDGRKTNRNTIVIADDKVRSMSDYWRKQRERSEQASAKRKFKKQQESKP